MLEPQPNSRAS